MRLRSAQNRSAVYCLVASLLLSPMTVASAAGPADKVNEVINSKNARVYDVSHRPKLNNAKRYVIQGTPKDGGCAFAIKIHKEPDEGPKQVRDIAFDPTTCKRVIEEGNPTELPPVKDWRKTGSEVAPPAGTGAPTSGPTVTAQALYTGQVTLNTEVEDPVYITVNTVRDTVKWQYNGSNAWYQGGSYYLWWAWDGWRLVSDSSSGGNYPSMTAAYYRTNAHFQNNIFCAFQTTNTYFRPHEVQGLANGGADTWVYWWADGGCSSWLHAVSTLY